MSILLAALFLTAQPAAQAPAAAPAAPPAAPAKPKKEKKICRVDDADTGTHMVKRVCLTQEQWDAQRGMNVDEFKATMPGAH